MAMRSPPSGLLPSGEHSGELIGRLTDGLVALELLAMPGEAARAPPRSVAMPVRPEELKRLLAAIVEERRALTAQVQRLEAELRRNSAEVVELRRELRGAVRDALTDPLTGLANRRAFDLELEAVSARASRSSSAHLLMADIDHFKRVNDAYGHDIGDQILRIVAALLLANIRRDGLVARVGGEEFGLLLPGTSPQYAARIAGRLCELLASRPLVVSSRPEVVERITISIGVAGRQPGESSARWYARADAALYQAKRNGRNRVAVHARHQIASEVRDVSARECEAVTAD